MSSRAGSRSESRLKLGIGAVIVLVIGAFAVTVVVGMWRGAITPAEVIPSPSASSATGGASIDASSPAGEGVGAAPTKIYVHVSGEVHDPGLYVLETGARTADAIAAAGGFTDEAQPAAVNLARVLSDGEQLHVPAAGEQAPPSAGSPTTGGATGLIDLNRADAQTLETLPGIGAAIAGRILDWRETHGDFTSVADLLAVSGIGDRTLEQLRPLVTV